MKKEHSSVHPSRALLSSSEINDHHHTRRKARGTIIDSNSLQMLEEKRDVFYILSLILHNTKPVGHQVSFVDYSNSLVANSVILVAVILKCMLFSFPCFNCRIWLVW